MQGENRFIKLLLFSTVGGEVLLYGFSSPTNQPFLRWKQREFWKKAVQKEEKRGNSQIPKMRGKQMEKSLGQVRARKWQKMR